MSLPASRHRPAFLATLAAGIAMLGVSFHGMAGVESDLRAATLDQGPRTTLVSYERDAWDCPDRAPAREERPRGLDEQI